MGAAGDMLTAALCELLPDPDGFFDTLNGMGLDGVEITREPAVRCGISGTRVLVRVHGEHEGGHEHEHRHHRHSGMHETSHIVERLKLPDKVKKDVMNVYDIIARAESAVHGVPVEEIHFHEVGTLDAVADVAGVCLAMHILAPDSVTASAVHVGSGQVKCAHGILPVPAPATALILKDVPIYGGRIEGELCTPTGAALLKYFCQSFGSMPLMRVKSIGCGCGSKEFEAANAVRAFLGETDGDGGAAELACNVDDMTAEEIGFALERLLEAGALDAFTTPAGMKKSRPGTLITVICRPADADKMYSLLFRHTSTIGVREYAITRRTLCRSIEEKNGVRVKTSEGFGVRREKYEFEDIARIARETGKSLAEVRRELDGK